jgi:hypothetical protein
MVISFTLVMVPSRIVFDCPSAGSPDYPIDRSPAGQNPGGDEPDSVTCCPDPDLARLRLFPAGTR